MYLMDVFLNKDEKITLDHVAYMGQKIISNWRHYEKGVPIAPAKPWRSVWHPTLLSIGACSTDNRSVTQEICN